MAVELSFLASLLLLFLIILFLKNNMSRNNSKSTCFLRASQVKLLLGALCMMTIFIALFAYASYGSSVFSIEYLTSTPITTDSAKQSPCKPDNEFEYGIIFDAGSTGSRVHVFKFKCVAPTGMLELKDELFEAVKPGLSSYADRPEEGAESLRPLMEKAKNYIPEQQWTQTPVALKATAGLRLLSEATAQRILHEVTKMFKLFPFKMAPNSVSILEGADEGLFCWFTVNFLHGFLTPSSVPYGVLDLGGGSTQITFLSSASSTKSGKRIVKVDIFGTEYTLYSYSYLGLGLNSGRFQAIGGEEPASGTLQSPCFPDNFEGKWKHAEKLHTIRSAKNVTSRFDECYAAVQKVIKSYSMDHPQEIATTTFYALSYYVDRATDFKLIDSESGGIFSVDRFYNAARKECQQVSEKDQFGCLDMCYIAALLHDGLGFPKTSSLLLKKQIRKIEIAWPLGAMFDVYGLFKRKTE